MNPEILADLVQHYQQLVVCQGRQSEISLMPVIKTLLALGVQADWLRDAGHFGVYPLVQNCIRPEMAFPTDSYA